MKMRQPRKGRAVTLIEVLVVLALISMLAGVMSYGIILARRLSIKAACQENLRHIGATLNQIMLNSHGAYPELADDNEFPWWAKVCRQWEGVGDLDTDSDPTNGLQLSGRLPGAMQSFHCRMAGALDGSSVSGLNDSISYGLNFDVKDSATDAYHADNHAAPYSTRFPDSLNMPDKRADLYYYTEIKDPAQFILVSEADTQDKDPLEWTGGRIAASATDRDGSDEPSGPSPIVGRHNGYANVLFADMHVEVRRASTDERADWNVNDATNLWTLPAD